MDKILPLLIVHFIKLYGRGTLPIYVAGKAAVFVRGHEQRVHEQRYSIAKVKLYEWQMGTAAIRPTRPWSSYFTLYLCQVS